MNCFSFGLRVWKKALIIEDKGSLVYLREQARSPHISDLYLYHQQSSKPADTPHLFTGIIIFQSLAVFYFLQTNYRQVVGGRPLAPSSALALGYLAQTCRTNEGIKAPV